jgi:hypothetical protein
MGGAGGSGGGAPIIRPHDPVVMTGAQLAPFVGLAPTDIVGFRFENNTWKQIPVQVDERALLDIVTPYGPLAAAASYPPSPSNPKVVFYCDAATHTGADPDPAFDNDDELVFMAKDAGDLADGSLPPNVVNGSARRITVADPLGGAAFVYLFQKAGALDQGAGVKYVTYTSNLAGTMGFPANGSGTNNESTTIATASYTWHFSSEWVSDELKLTAGNGADVLDRYKNFFADGNCIRHEDAFSGGENAYVTARSGPVRVIRSYMGAVSGPLTQRTHIFYDKRQDIQTDLRVHNIVSIYDAFDYTSSANGMSYRNNMNAGGVNIDGAQDVVVKGNLLWEQVSGAQGTVSILHRRVTDLTANDASFSSYYDDSSAKPASKCTGDNQAWGTSGVAVLFANGSVCTDPMGPGCAGSVWLRNLQAKRTVYVDGPNGAPTTAEDYNAMLDIPLVTTVDAYP